MSYIAAVADIIFIRIETVTGEKDIVFSFDGVYLGRVHPVRDNAYLFFRNALSHDIAFEIFAYDDDPVRIFIRGVFYFSAQFPYERSLARHLCRDERIGKYILKRENERNTELLFDFSAHETLRGRRAGGKYQVDVLVFFRNGFLSKVAPEISERSDKRIPFFLRRPKAFNVNPASVHIFFFYLPVLFSNIPAYPSGGGRTNDKYLMPRLN